MPAIFTQTCECDTTTVGTATPFQQSFGLSGCWKAGYCDPQPVCDGTVTAKIVPLCSGLSSCNGCGACTGISLRETVCVEDDCATGSTFINGRPPAGQPWSWGPYSAPDLVAFEAALTAAGYTVTNFGEKHQICPPFGAFGEDPAAVVTNAFGTSTPTVEPNIDPNYVPPAAGSYTGVILDARSWLVTVDISADGCWEIPESCLPCLECFETADGSNAEDLYGFQITERPIVGSKTQCPRNWFVWGDCTDCFPDGVTGVKDIHEIGLLL